MSHKIFNRDMEHYLERKNGCDIRKGKFQWIRCKANEWKMQWQAHWDRTRRLFLPIDPETQDIAHHSITIVDAGISPAQQFVHRIRKKAKHWWKNRKESKATYTKNPSDVDPSIIQDVIKRSKQ